MRAVSDRLTNIRSTLAPGKLTGAYGNLVFDESYPEITPLQQELDIVAG